MIFEDDQSTRHRVARSILVDGPSTAAALGERLDLTPAAVRRHLDQLVEDGAVEAREPRPNQQRGRGRPAKVFALTERGREGFDQQYDDLAVQALRFVRETGGEEAVRAFANERVAFIEDRFGEVAAARPELSPVEVLAAVLTDEGYAAAVKSLPLAGGAAVPAALPGLPRRPRVPAAVRGRDRGHRPVLGRHVQRLATIAHGDGVCTTCIPDIPSTRNEKEKVTT